jgi:AbrB family looped-hinge helix DNA binding protein
VIYLKIRVGSRGTIVIPKKVREGCGITEGDILEISVQEKAIVLMKDATWEKLHGCAKGLVMAEEVEKELDEDEISWEKRLKG